MSILSLFPGHRVRKASPASRAQQPDPVSPLTTVLRRRDRTPEAKTPPAGTTDEHPLQIPCPMPSDEDRIRDLHQQRGQFLARQDRWQELADAMRTADAARDMTPGGMPVADLLSFGARADVVLAVEHALTDSRQADNPALLSGIEALEEMLAEDPTCPWRAATVAMAHVDTGWFWRGTGWQSQVPDRNLEAFSAHFDRARDILDPFSSMLTTSPLLSSAHCALHGLGGRHIDILSRDFERLIDLNPMNPGPLRSLGNYSSPRWFGSGQVLELEARRTAARLLRHWGAGGYTWVMMDALAGDDTVCAQLDTDFFIEGLGDILDRRPDQYTANLLAAWCVNTIGRHPGQDETANAVRRKIAACAGWIVRHHMTELHPLIWAHAARGFDNNLHVGSARRFAASGREDALKLLRHVFRHEINQGMQIIFTAEGPVTKQG
ncbi:hypothetical protein [uncultured Roseobacter sp.]|uniref:hypothetical protein n=1 Tax=uncultured Roseobacter sp. TaxID=114847 RepID=UPI0026211458|nr:hypothetical protein [uncultured Roseobacter sp.]